MGVFRQLGQLFWKNFVLRKRQPHVLLLEVLWPLFIFAIVTIVRQGTLPSQQNTCSYNHHAMPSAGMVSFMQSTVCNLENPCGARVNIEQTQRSAQKLTQLVSSLQPYLTDTETVEALDAIDTGVKLVSALGDLNKNGTLTKVLNQTNFVVKNFLNNPDEVRRVLVDELKIMSGQTADALLNSTLNLGVVISNIGYINFRQIVCQVDSLQEYMLFRSGVNVTAVSRELCDIEDAKISEITDVLQRQLDVAAVIRSAKSLTLLTGKYELNDALDDMASLMDLLFGTSAFKSILIDYPTLLDLPHLIRKMPTWFDKLINMQQLDMSSIDAIVNFVDPLIQKVAPNNELWNVTKNIMGTFKEMANAVGDGKNVDWETVLHNGEALSAMLVDSNITAVLMPYIEAFTNPAFTNVTTALMTGHTNISQGTWVAMLDALQPSLEKILGKDADYSMIVFVEGMLDSVNIALHALKNLDVIDNLIEQNSGILDAVEILIREGPNITNAILEEFLTPKTIQDIFRNFSATNMKSTCKKILSDVLTDTNVMSQLEQSLCTDSVADVIGSVMKAFNYSVFEQEMQTAIMKISKAFNNTDTAMVRLSDFVYKIGNLTETAEDLFSSSEKLWTKIQEELANPINAIKWSHVNDVQWNMLYQKTTTLLAQASWPMMVTTVGPMLENSTMWTTLGPWMWTADTVMQYTIGQMNSMKDMTNENTTMGMLMKFVVDYAPEVTEAVTKMSVNTYSPVLMEITSNPDPKVLFCEKHILQEIMPYSYVPTAEMETKLCNTNWTVFANEMMATYDTAPMMEEITQYFQPGNNLTSKPFNWTGMVYEIQTLTDMMSDPAALMNMGPMYMLQSLNMTAVMAAVERGMSSAWTMLTMSSSMAVPNEMEGIMSNILQVMKQINKTAGNSSEWRVAKHYVKVWDDMVIVMNKYITKTQDGSAVNLEQFLSNMSVTFKNYVSDSVNLTPELVEILMNSTINPDKVLSKLMHVDFTKVCNGAYISDLFNSPSLRAYEDQLCQLNWTKIMYEIIQNDPDISAFVDEMNLILRQWHTLPDINIDWDEVANRSMKFIDLLSKGSFPNIDSNVFNLDTQRLNMTWQSYVKYLSTIQTLDMNKFADLVTQMEKLFNQLPSPAQDNSTQMLTEFMKVEEYLSYQSYAITQFIIKQLEYFNNSEVIDIRAYLNSSEANKILEMIEHGTEVDTYVTKAIINVMSKPDEISKVVTSFGSICNDTSVLRSLVPSDNSTDIALVQSRLCGIVLNETVLMEQLYNSISGLRELVDGFSLNIDSNFTSVSYGEVLAAQNKISALIEDLIRHPRNFTLGHSDAWMDGNTYMKQWESVLHTLEARFTMENVTQDTFTNLATDIQKLVTQLLGSQSNASGMTDFMKVEEFMSYQSYSVMQFIVKQLEYFNSTKVINIKTYMNSTQVNKIMEMIENGPEIDTFVTKAIVNALSKPEELSRLVSSFGSICNDTSVLRSLVPNDNTIDIALVQSRLCGIVLNETVLMEELYHSIGGLKELVDGFSMSMDSNFSRVNYAESIKLQTRITELVTDLVKHPRNFTLGGSDAWMDGNTYMKQWESVLHTLEARFTMENVTQDTFTNLATDIQKIVTQLLGSQSNASGMTDFMKVEEFMSYQSYSVMQFIVKQLEYFNSTKVINIKTYMNSSQVNKILEMIENGPEIDTFVTKAIVNVLSKPEELSRLVSSFGSICNDTSVLQSLVPNDNTIDIALVQSRLCGIVLNETVMMEELYNSIGGLKELVDGFFMSMDSNFTRVNYAESIKLQTRITELVTDLFKHPRNFTLGGSDAWMDGNTYMKEWESVLHFMEARFAPENLTQYTTSSISSLLPLIMASSADTMRSFEIAYMFISKIMERVDQMNETVFSIEYLMGDSPELLKMWRLIQRPGVVEVLMNSINTPQMSQLFGMSAHDALTQLCHPVNNNFTYYFKVPSYATIDINHLQRDFCDSNITVVLEELMNVFDLHEIMQMLNGSQTPTMNREAMLAQFTRFQEKITHWIENPPIVTGISENWRNESYWLQLLTDYAESMQSSQNITTQVQNSLQSLGPLLTEEPFRSYGLFMEELLKVIKANLNFDFNGLTMENLVDRLPILHDLFTSLNMTTDMLKMILAAPFKHPNAMVDLIGASDIGAELCSSSSKFWQRILDWSSLPGSTPVAFNYCNQTESEFFKKLVEDLKLTDVLGAMSQMQGNNTVQPDWQKIFQESAELSNHIQSIINNTSTGFDIGPALDYLNSLYQNDVLAATNFTELYAQLHAIIGNTPEWEMIDDFFRAGQILTDFLNGVFDKIGVPSGRIDLGLLFKNTTRIKALLEAVHVDEELISGWLTGFIKYEKYMDFLTMLNEPNRTAAFLCDEAQWRMYFNFPASVNVTKIVMAVCGVDGEELQKELVEQLRLQNVLLLVMPNSTLPRFDVQSFIKSIQHMSDNIGALMNVSSVDFSGLDLNKLGQLNQTVIWSKMEAAWMNLTQSYATLIPGISESVMPMMSNGTEFRTAAAMVTGFTLWTRMLNERLTVLLEQPLNMSLLFGGSSVDPAIRILLTDPRWIEELSRLQVNPEKLLSSLTNSSGTELCHGIMQSIVDPQNATVLPELEAILCSINQSTWVTESMTMFLADLQYSKQFEALVSEAMKHATSMNISAYSYEATKLSNLLNKLFSRNYTQEEIQKNFDFSAFTAVLERIGKSWESQISQTITQGIPMLLQSLMSIQSPEVAKAMKTVNLLLGEINDRLEYVKDSVTVETLMKNSTFLASIFRMSLNTNNETINGLMLEGIHFDKFFTLMVRPNDIKVLCQNSSLAQYLTTGNTTTMLAKDVATLLCTDIDTYVEKLYNESDIGDLMQRLESLLHGHGNTTFDMKELNKNIQRFNQLLDHMIKNPPSVDGSLATISLGGVFEALGKFFNDPSKLFTLTASANPYLSTAPVPHDAIPFVVAWQQTYNHIEKIFTSNVGSLNNSILASFYNSLTSFNTRANLLAWTPAYYEMVLEEAGKKSEIHALVCNVTAMQQRFGGQNNFSSTFGANVSPLLCGSPSSEWYNHLESYGLAIWPGISDFAAEIEKYYKEKTGRALVEHVQFKWSDMVTQIDHIVRWFSDPNVDWNDVVQAVFGDTQTTQDQIAELVKSSISWMKSLGIENNKDFVGIVNILSEINDYLTRQIDLLMDQGKDVPFTALLPNNTELARLLEKALGKDTAAALFASVVSPDQFLLLSLSDQWAAVTCNMTRFKSTFKFPPGTNVTLIQQDLCRDASDKQSAVSNILSRLDMTDVLKALENFMRGNVRANTTDVWYQIEKMSGQLLLNIGYLTSVNLTMGDIDKWMAPILKSLQTIQSPSMDNLESTCDGMLVYIENTDFYKEMEPYLYGVMRNMYLTKQQMQVQRAIEDIICDLPTLNVTTISHRLREANITEFIQALMNINTTTTMGKFSCSRMIEMSTDLYNMWNESLTYSMEQSQNWAQCLQQGFSSPATVFQDISKSFAMAGELLQLLNDPSLQIVTGNPDLVPVLEFMLRVYHEQQNIILKMADLLLMNSSAVVQIQNIFETTPQLLDTLLKSTIALNAEDLLNKTSAEIASILCDANKLDSIIHLPAFAPNATISEISSTLCGPNVVANADIVKEMISLGTLSLAVTTHGYNVSDTTWWSNVGTHLSKVLSIIQEFNLIDLGALSNLDINNIETDLLNYLQEFIYSSGPETLAKSIKVLLEDFKSIDNSTFTRSIISDMEVMIDGLLSLKVIRNFIPANVLIRDVLKDPDALRDYMTTNLSLSLDVANAVLDGTIYYASLLKYKEKDLPGLVCNASRFSELINISSTVVTAADVSASLCNMNESSIVKLADTVLNQLSIGKLVESYVTASLDDFLGQVNMSNDNVQSAISKISKAQKKLEDAAYQFENKTAEFDIEFVLEPEAFKGASSMSSVQDIVCGTYSASSSSSQISDVTGVASTVGQPKLLTPEQEREMKTLPGEFCQELYKEIILQVGGPVIWSYLKPLVRGKILFSPDTPATRSIVAKMNVSSFAELAEVQKLSKSWSKGTSSIADLLKDTASVKEAMKVLKDPAIDSLLSIFSLSATEIRQGFDSIETMDTNQLGNISQLAQIFSNYTNCIETDRFYGQSSEEELQKEAIKLHRDNQFLAGIVFENMETTSRKKRQAGSGLPKHIMYKIRMDIDNVGHTSRLKERFWRPDPEDNFFTQMRYFRGFIQLQDILERSIIELHNGNPVNTTTYLQQFPTPCHVNDLYLNVLSSYLLPIMMTVAWLASMALSTKNLVYDRENGQEEALKTMGMRSALNWWTWFITTMLIMSLVSLISIIVMRAGNLFVNSNFLILFLYFLVFCYSCITMCYMVSAFFTRTTMAMLTVLIVYLLSYIPYVVLISLETTMEYWQKTLACLLSTTAFGFGAQYLSRFEIQQEGVHWYNIRDSPMQGDEFSFSWACLMMLIDGSIYLVIGWYIRNVKPGKYGVSKPFYFLFTTSYWGCGSCGNSTSDLYKATDRSGALVEETDDKWVPGISIRGLSKTFGSNHAVKNISCDFYEGQITVLLGHNGAAKTTTINMITGVLEPSKGSVYVYGKPASENSRKIGICPQHNALFEYMNVQEHVEFYACIKSGASKLDLKMDVERLLKEVELWHVRHERVSNLSGGMKRKLCVALAFAGGSEAVVLDEPTSGVDPCGRRAIWNLVQRQKTRCTILLSTHFLDEADIIGDRVAVMHEGRVMCAGSPMYLKRSLGSGYHLKFVKGDNCDVSAVLSMIQYTIPGAEVVDQIGSEVTISLPLEGVTISDLQLCLQDIDTNARNMSIGNYGIYDTTMDEVFSKVCSIAESNKPMTDEVIAKTKRTFKIERPEEEKLFKEEDTNGQPGKGPDPRKRVSSTTQKWQQFTGLLIKRFHHYRRDWRMFLSVIILPLVFVTAGLGFMLIKPESTAPSRILTPPLYGPNSYTFIKDSLQSSMSRGMMNHFKAKPGLGTTCMEGVNFGNPFKCVEADTTFTMTPGSTSGKPNCTCTKNQYTCNDAAKNQKVPTMQLETTTHLEDLGNHDVEQYLLHTWEMHKLDRYGGWSIEVDDNSQAKGRVWFNNKGHHAMPSFYNAYSNTLLRALMGNKGMSDPEHYGITAVNHPLMLSEMQLTEDTIIQNAADMGISLVFLVAFTFIPVGFVVYVVNEYKKREKQLQYISGVGPVMYWVTALIWDLFIFCVTVGLAVAIMAIFRHNSYWYRDNLAGVTLLVILYGWATIPFMYSTVKAFRDSTSAYMVLFCGCIFVGLSTVVITFLLEFMSSQPDVKKVFDVVRQVFLIFPQFSFVYGFMDIIKMQVMTDILSRFGEDLYQSPFSFDLIAWNYIALAIEGLVFFILTLLLETSCCCKTRVPSDLESEMYTDSEEVNNERQRVQTGYGHSDAIVVSNLSKVYKRGRKPFLAVDRLCFGVPKGECFGLLGVNGAGKTTTFRMLTGDLVPSEGTAYLKGQRIAQGKSNIGQELGYCPQEDALDRFLSGRELLHCYARLRGIPSGSRDRAVNDLISKLNMSFADKAIHTYSGGMKRKLSVAVALIGEPPVVLMDEPTTGMDPGTKRLVWNCILSAIRNNQSVILTSHSMEECDALCSRLAIMVNGEFKCMGSSQLLKQKYGDGYTVMLYTCGLSTVKHDIVEVFNSYFPGSHATVQHQGVLQVSIPKGSTSVAQILQVLEEQKERCNIQHYSVSQTTLYNVFLNFAREQTDGTIPESTGSVSDSYDDTSDRYLAEPFINPAYAYMNPGLEIDEEKFQKPLILSDLDISTKL